MLTFDYCSQCPDEVNCCKGKAAEADESRITLTSVDKLLVAPKLVNNCGNITCNNLGESACTLASDYKPVVCKAYPFYPIMTEGAISFGISAKCPVASSMISEFFRGNKKFLLDNLNDAKELITSLPDKDLIDWSKKTTNFLISIKLSEIL